MENYIEIPKMSEILSEEFMIPFGLSAYKLAQEIRSEEHTSELQSP